MKFAFSKISSSGNDFILIDNRTGIFTGRENSFFEKICRRRTGIGADGLILLEFSQRHDFKYRYFNSDGFESTMCGNGGRAIAYYAYYKDIAGRDQKIEVSDGIHKAFVEDDEVAFEIFLHTKKIEKLSVTVNKQIKTGYFLNTGVPHFIIEQKSVDSVNVEKLGNMIRNDSTFQPIGTNVNFVEIINKNTVKIRTYERGVEEETLACGTGIVASAIALNESRDMKYPLTFLAHGGVLKVESSYDGYFLSGNVEIVFEGTKTME